MKNYFGSSKLGTPPARLNCPRRLQCIEAPPLDRPLQPELAPHLDDIALPPPGAQASVRLRECWPGAGGHPVRMLSSCMCVLGSVLSDPRVRPSWY